jgi:hypothetical protein
MMTNNNKPQRPLNELERDDVWSRAVIDRLLKPLLRAHAFENQVHFIGKDSPVALLLQKTAHVDALVPLSNGGDLSLELKVVRWPFRDGEPSSKHWSDFFLETMSCSVRGHEQQGWMITCQADFLLWCQCSLHEHVLKCWPLPMKRLRAWFFKNQASLPERSVRNPINGRDLWTIGRLASISKVCTELKVEGFYVTDTGLVCDLLGAPILRFMQEPPAAA